VSTERGLPWSVCRTEYHEGVKRMTISMDPATLRKAANDIRSTKNEVDASLKALWNVVDDLAIAWLGEASNSFQRLMHRWDEDTRRLTGAMTNIAHLLDDGSVKGEQNDQEQSAMLNRFNNALNP
jgi:WXG100 family type VII secretion target